MRNTNTEAVLRRVLLAALAAVMMGRIALTWRVFNDTVDEAGHVRSGLEILERGTYRIEAQHPPVSRLVLAVLPYWFGGLRLGHGTDLWERGPWGEGDVGSYWKTLTLARAGNLLFALLLFGVVYRWSGRLYGPWSGVAACALVACCPNVLAHAGLATVDLAAAATILLAAYCFWRWSEQPGLGWSVASAAAFSLAVLSKFSALLFLPPLALVYFLAGRWKHLASTGARDVLAGAGRAGVFCLVVVLLVWAGYLFEVGMLVPPHHQFLSPYSMGHEGSLPNVLLKLFGTIPLPAHRLVQGVIEVASHNEEGHPSYLLGHVAQRGLWYYFAVAVAVKSTLPLLLLAALGVVVARRKALHPLLAVLVILGLSMQASINIGIRHVLALYPFFAILAAGAFRSGRRAITVAALALAAWHAGESIAAHPDYLAYFNEIARGREERFLVDSNLDWGQDLRRLGQYLREHRIESVHLIYFGRTRPERMGVAVHEAPQGWVAVSVSHLMMRRDLAWLRALTPKAKVGKSIWLYYVEPKGAS